MKIFLLKGGIEATAQVRDTLCLCRQAGRGRQSRLGKRGASASGPESALARQHYRQCLRRGTQSRSSALPAGHPLKTQLHQRRQCETIPYRHGDWLVPPAVELTEAVKVALKLIQLKKTGIKPLTVI